MPLPKLEKGVQLSFSELFFERKGGYLVEFIPKSLPYSGLYCIWQSEVLSKPRLYGGGPGGAQHGIATPSGGDPTCSSPCTAAACSAGGGLARLGRAFSQRLGAKKPRGSWQEST